MAPAAFRRIAAAEICGSQRAESNAGVVR